MCFALPAFQTKDGHEPPGTVGLACPVQFGNNQLCQPATLVKFRSIQNESACSCASSQH